MDNGAYSGFDVTGFMAMLERFYRRPGCRFVAAPDVVADAHTTLGNWPFWSRVIRSTGFPPALVGQDGMTTKDIPWSEICALFIGGTTEWKLSDQAARLIGMAKARGLWVHMGRVNTHQRIRTAYARGCDSIDGSAFSKWPDTHIPGALDSMAAAGQQASLFA